MMHKILAGAAALSMMATPAVAQTVSANPAAKLSLAKSVPGPARTSTVAGKNKALAGGGLIAIVAAAAVVLGIVVIADGDDDSDSN